MSGETVAVGWLWSILSSIEISGILETLIGTFAAFALGLWAFGWQQKKLAAERAAEAEQATAQALGRAVISCGMNLDALAAFQLQISDVLQEEAERIKSVVDHVNEGGLEVGLENQRRMAELAQALAGLRSFFFHMGTLSVSPFPSQSELSVAYNRMPVLATLLYRGEESMRAANADIKQRNRYVEEFATEQAEGGISFPRMHYLASMLADHARNIIDAVHDAREFLFIALDQISMYQQAKVPKGQRLTFSLGDETIKRLPREDRFPKLRAQLVGFEQLTQSTKRSIR